MLLFLISIIQNQTLATQKLKFQLLAMKLTFGQGKLPVAHTCFFSIELPEYSTEEEMRTGLLTAINYGVGGILLG